MGTYSELVEASYLHQGNARNLRCSKVVPYTWRPYLNIQCGWHGGLFVQQRLDARWIHPSPAGSNPQRPSLSCTRTAIRHHRVDATHKGRIRLPP